jgi:pilus assembly protein Flp/PilA
MIFKDKSLCERVTVVLRIINKAVYFLTDNSRGATAVEYALMVALIAIAIVLAVTAFGLGLSGGFENSAEKIGTAFGNIGI